MSTKNKTAIKSVKTPKKVHAKTITIKKIFITIVFLFLIGTLINGGMSFLAIIGLKGTQSVIHSAQYTDYVSFARSIMPANYTLVQTTEDEGSIDTPYAVDQTYQISETRKEIMTKLTPLFIAKGYTANENIFGGKYDDNQEFSRTGLTNKRYPYSITINFIPNDCDTPPPGLPPSCVKYGWRDPRHVMHTAVTDINISWE